MFLANTSKSEIPYHTSASGSNMLRMKTFGLITPALFSALAGMVLVKTFEIRQLAAKARLTIERIFKPVESEKGSRVLLDQHWKDSESSQTYRCDRLKARGECPKPSND
jgi:hypothetical protein